MKLPGLDVKAAAQIYLRKILHMGTMVFQQRGNSGEILGEFWDVLFGDILLK